eukprot:364078_1
MGNISNISTTDDSNSLINTTDVTSKQNHDTAPNIQKEQQKDVNFKIFVGVDFGTDGCGLAYAFSKKLINKNDDNNDDEKYDSNDINNVYVEIHTNFDDVGPYEKSTTSVLFDDKNRVKVVGSTAANVYINTENNQEWKLFERFKMSLYDDPRWNVIGKTISAEKVDLRTHIIPANGGTGYASSQVFMAMFQNLKKIAYDHMIKNFRKKKRIKFTEEEVQWILTVPAIWSDYAKSVMKSYAIQAGLVSSHVRNQLKIVYEPDCGSLAIQYACNKHGPLDESRYWSNKITKKTNVKINHTNQTNITSRQNIARDYAHKKKYNDEMKHGQTSNGIIYLKHNVDPGMRFEKNDKYILIDVGGGTCDVAVHQITNDFCIEELLYPSGGAWGAMNIDEAFVKLLYQIFGDNTMIRFKESDRGMWLQLEKNFRTAKTSFYLDKNSTNLYHDVMVPNSFADLLIKQFNGVTGINQLLNNKSEFMNSIQFKQRQNSNVLSFHIEIFMKLFDEVINRIISHVDKILQTKKIIDCKYIMLIGGLSNSRYFQEKIYEAFGFDDEIKIIVPYRPQLMVVQGAALYGVIPNYINTRRISQTYGIRIDYNKATLPNIELYSTAFLEANGYFDKTTGKEYVKNIFSVFVKKNSTVKFDDEPIRQSYYRRHRNQKTIDIKIYSSSMENPLSVLDSNCKHLASMQIIFNANKSNWTDELEIIVEFYFNETVLRVDAYPKNELYKKQQLQLQYD